MKISIIDDNFVNCYVLKEFLSNKQEVNEITTYIDPSVFLEDLFNSVVNPDIILTDIMMPAIDGYYLTKYVKKKFPNIRIIGITALPKSREVIKQVTNCGMENIIFKPYDMKSLLEYLKIKN